MKTKTLPLPRIELAPYYERGILNIAVVMIYAGVSWEAWSIKSPREIVPKTPVSPDAVEATMKLAFDSKRPIAKENIADVFPEIREMYIVKGVSA